MGSTRLTVDDTGTPIGTREWDAWGNQRSSTGTGYAFGWTGEQFDPSSDLVYLRARYYSAGTASFLSRDTVQPNAGGPTGYNPYAYANCNPTTFTDPSGHFSFGDIANWVGGAISAIFLYMAAVLECFSTGNCRYKRKWGDSATNDTVRSGPSAADWVSWAIDRGIQWINRNWPSDLAGWPDFLPIPTWPCIYPCLTDKLLSHYPEAPISGVRGECFGADGAIPGVIAQIAACLVIDSHSNRGLAVTVAALGGGVITVFGGSITGSALQSTVDTIFDLRGGALYVEGSAVPLAGAFGGASLSNVDGRLHVTTQEGFGWGVEIGAGIGPTYTWVEDFDTVKDAIKLVIDYGLSRVPPVTIS